MLTKHARANNLLLHRIVLVASRSILALLPSLAPLGVYPFVQRHTDGVHLADRAVEMCLVVSVCSERLLDVPRPAVLRVELDRLEVRDVLCSAACVRQMNAIK